MADEKKTEAKTKKSDDKKLLEAIGKAETMAELMLALDDSAPADRSKAVNRAVYEATQRIVNETVPLP